MSFLGLQNTMCHHHCCHKYQPDLWWLDVIRVTDGYGKLKWCYNNVCYRRVMTKQTVLVQQVLCWEMVTDIHFVYVCICGQYPCS